MEYDNDRKLYPPHKMEIFYWAFICLLNPVVNTLTFFWWDAAFGILLLFANLLTIPLYILFARIVVPRFFFENRSVYFVSISIIFFLLNLSLMSGLNSLISDFEMNPQEKFYFANSARTLVRSGFWTLINMLLAFTIAFLRRAFDEREQIR